MKHLLFTVLLSIFCFDFTIANEWELAKNSNGVKVYTRKAEGTDILEFKAITTVKSNMKSLEVIMDDVVDYKNWQANIETVKILKQVNSSEKYVYYTTDVPWPITSRDMIFNIKKTTSSAGILLYTVTSAANYTAEDSDYIRMKEANGSWTFTPQSNGNIEVVYKFFGDPRGSLPDWVINMFIVDGPYKALTNLKAKVEK